MQGTVNGTLAADSSIICMQFKQKIFLQNVENYWVSTLML